MAERAQTPPRPRSGGASILAAAAALVALWPYTGAILPGAWTFVAVAMVVVATVSGGVARALSARARSGARSLVALLLQLLVLAVTGTVLLAAETARFGVVPTAATAQLIGLRLQRALEEISEGIAPIAATASMTTAMGLAFAVVAVLIDHLLAQRLIMLAVLFTSVVGAVPMLLSFGSVNFAWFLLQAVMILLILRLGARHDRDSPRHSPLLMASVIGTAGIAFSLAVAPVLPLSSALPGTGPMMTVSANLRLGDDLRRPEGVEALTLVTSASAPPYLRLATLSRFDGEIWRPDRSEQRPVDEGFGDRPWRDPIGSIEHEVSIRVVGVSSDRLPVPYAAETITGLGRGWRAMPLNRTVLSATEDAAGADYTVQMAIPAPTLEQIRSAPAAGAELVGAPAVDLPPVIGELAREVTAGAETDYDRLIALQTWFRSEFEYSLDAPVEDGFDGTGADAVAEFLEVRSGYCIHFAGAFALMAQTLDMPVRIVVGYLPGTATEEKRGDDRVYSVSSDQLHSWPEVFFSGIGWVPFEPTATLGTPTEFASAAAGGGDEAPTAPQPSSGATPAPSSSPGAGPDRPDEGADAGNGAALRRLDPTPVVLGGTAVLIVLLLPAVVRAVRRMRRLERARRGDALSAWQELTDTIIDLGLPMHEAETARVRARVLVDARGADPDALQVLVDGVERRSYAERMPDGDDLSAPLKQVLARLEAGVSGRRRLTARLVPRSLLPRR